MNGRELSDPWLASLEKVIRASETPSQTYRFDSYRISDAELMETNLHFFNAVYASVLNVLPRASIYSHGSELHIKMEVGEVLTL